jgi:hypothetical protein
MKLHYKIAVALACATGIYMHAQVAYDWHFVTGDNTSGAYNNYISAIGTGDSNYVYVAGHTAGNPDIDPGAGTVIIPNNGNPNDGYMAVYTPNGDYVRSWRLSTNAGSNNSSAIEDMCIASNGDVLLCGLFQGTTDFDPSAAVNAATSAGTGGYIARYTKLGQLIWLKTYTTPVVSTYVAPFCISEAGGEITVGGAFSLASNSTVDLDPDAGVASYSHPNGGYYGFLMRFSASGSYTWSKGFIGKTVQEMDVNALGEIACTGQVAGTADFDPGAGVASYTAQSAFPFGDFYVAYYSAAGDYYWHHAAGTSAAEGTGYAVAFDAASNICVTGLCAGGIDLDPGPGVVISGASGSWLAKYYSIGSLAWAINGGEGLALDANDNVYATGMLGVRCFSPGGMIYWSGAVADQQFYTASCMAVSPTGQIHIGWQHWMQEDVDPGAGVINTTYSQNGSSYIVLTLDHLSTGIPVEETPSAYSVYPNPATEFITVNGDGSSAFTVFNSFGQEVLTQISNSTQTRIDVSTLPAGMYYLRTAEGVYVQSFVITR